MSRVKQLSADEEARRLAFVRELLVPKRQFGNEKFRKHRSLGRPES